MFADSRDALDDPGFVKKYESVSTLMIVANKGPIIIKENTFENNIGTAGGVIHIMSPDFESSGESDQLPYIFI